MITFMILGTPTAKAESPVPMMKAIFSFFTHHYTYARQTLSFMKERAESAKKILSSSNMHYSELARQLNIQINRSYDLLQENRPHLSNDLYTTFKARIDRAHHHVMMFNYYQKKNQREKAITHFRSMESEIEDTLFWIKKLETLTGHLS